MVYEKQISEYECIHNEKSNFKSIFNDEEKTILIELVKRVFNREFTNEKSVRLDAIEVKDKMKIKVSLSEFYDFLSSNFIVLNLDKLMDYSNEVEKELLLRFKKILDNNKIKCFDDIYNADFLSNIIAVSCVIIDKNGHFFLTRRNNNVGIANGYLSVSVTGSVDGEDYNKNDPFIACCSREIREELGFIIDECCDVKFKKFVCGEKKLQPIALIDVIVDDIQKVINTLKSCEGFNEENSKYFICDRDEVKALISNDQYNITEAGLAHLESLL